MRQLLLTVCTFLLLFFLVFCGCDLGDSVESEPMLNASVDGTSVTYAVNQSFSLELDLNADAGYSWFYAISDTNVVHLDSIGYRPKSGNWNMDGGMTVETFHFRTKKNGQCSISLDERQGWEPNVPPIHSVRFTVIVFH
jgi:predicted secreted protein